LRSRGFETYEVVFGFTPRLIAVVSTNVLNAEPGWRWPWAARLNCLPLYVELDAIALM
jgi:hypothetical protein